MYVSFEKRIIPQCIYHYEEKGPLHFTGSETMPVPLNFKCNRTWDDKTGNFTYKLDWTVPSDMNVQRAISSFVVTVDVVSPDGTTEQLSSTPYPFIVSIYCSPKLWI